jgi:cyclopropane-fatty-acyl-phospholipid synthase
MRKSPVALVPEKANEQHYEVPPAFFLLTLGPHLKYSSAFYPDSLPTDKSHSENLGDAESAMLKITCERAKLQDGHDILELGCGWGSLSLWMAEHYPKAKITSVSNSGP